ncbi:MAG: ABC transporter permease [Chthoniobacterales bacterium]|nr:ABC transporter permease [Chthoniobacterales bacterium]
MIHRLVSLVRKELQALLRDPQSRRLLIVPVILQLLLFPSAATLEVKNETLAIFNEDTGPHSLELMQRFAQAKAFKKTLTVHRESEMRRLIDRQQAVAVLRFPQTFSREVESHHVPQIQAVVDGRRSNSGQVSIAYLQEIVQKYQREKMLAATPQIRPLSDVVVRHWFNPNLNNAWSIVPSLVAIITTISTLIVTALSVAREREQGTFDQLLVSPLTPGMIMVGKAVPALFVSIVQATIIVLGGVFAYRISFQGSFLLLYSSMIFYIIALAGFGLLISSICQTQQQAFLGVFSFMMPAVLLSGFISPVENMPGWLRAVTWFDPLRHFIIIVKGVFLKDMSTAAVASNAWPLLVIGVVTLAGANFVFRRRLG